MRNLIFLFLIALLATPTAAQPLTRELTTYATHNQTLQDITQHQPITLKHGQCTIQAHVDYTRTKKTIIITATQMTCPSKGHQMVGTIIAKGKIIIHRDFNAHNIVIKQGDKVILTQQLQPR